MRKYLRSAMFCIVDTDGHPRACGFFVTANGIGLTSAHDAWKWASVYKTGSRVRAADSADHEFEFDVITHKVGSLDVAVLRRVPLSAASPLPEVPYLTLPKKPLDVDEDNSKPVRVVPGSISWNMTSDTALYNDKPRYGEDLGYISTLHKKKIVYRIPTLKSYSDAALLMEGFDVVGIHTQGFNDLDQEYSERSPSGKGEATRLDLPEIRTAIERAAKAAPEKRPAWIKEEQARGGRGR